MAIQGGTYPTLLDVFSDRATEASRDLLPIAEILNQSNEIVEHMPWMESNLLTANRTAVRTGLPTIYTRRYNEGIPASKSSKVQMDESIAQYAALSMVDRDLAELGGNPRAKRLEEATAKLEAFGQTLATDVFYGSEAVNPEKFNGLLTRYTDPASTTYGDQMIDGGAASGQTDCMSAVITGWGPRTATGIYPLGTSGGLKRQDFGLELVADANSNYTPMYREEFSWKAGISIKDPRAVVRIHSIDTSVLQANYAATDVLGLFVEAIARLPMSQYGGSMQPRIYVPRNLYVWIQRQALDKRNNVVTQDNVLGKPQTQLMGIPLHMTDALLTTEASLN